MVLSHKSSQATQIYSRLNNDPVRQSMEKAIALINNTTVSNSNKKLVSYTTPSCKDQEVLDTFEDLASKFLVKEVGHGAYINKVHSVEELGYNPKSKVRLCRAKVMVLSASDNNTYVTFLVDYTTTKSRVEISDRWLPI